MKLYSGQKVKVRIYKKRPGRWNSDGLMDMYMDKIVTINKIAGKQITIMEDDDWIWDKSDFEPVFFLPEELFEI